MTEEKPGQPDGAAPPPDAAAPPPAPPAPPAPAWSSPAGEPPVAPVPGTAEQATAPTVAAPSGTPAGAPPAAPQPKRKRLGLILGLSVGGGLLLIASALVVTYAGIAGEHAPDRQVSAYLQHLVDGEAEAAIDLLYGEPTDSTVFLTDDIYQSASNTITAFEITGTHIDREMAFVTADITQGGSVHEKEFLLSRVGTELLVFDVWSLDSSSIPFAVVSFPRPDGIGLAVNGTSVPGFTGLALEARVLPGTYTLTAENAGEYFSVEETTLEVSFGELGARSNLQVELSELGIAAGRAAVDAHLDGCLAQKSLTPVGNCGFTVTGEPGTTYSNIRWKAETRPVVGFNSYIPGDGWLVVPETMGALRFDADYDTATEYGTAWATFPDFAPFGIIKSIDENGVAVFESEYTE